MNTPSPLEGISPIYGKRGIPVMFVNVDSTDPGVRHMVHLCKRYYDWTHDDLSRTAYRAEGLFVDHEAYISTLRYWNKKMTKFSFGTNFKLVSHNYAGVIISKYEDEPAAPILIVDEFDDNPNPQAGDNS